MKKLFCFLIIPSYLSISCANYGGSGVANTGNSNIFNNGYASQDAKNYTGSAEEVKSNGTNITLDNYLRKVSGILVTGDGPNAKVQLRGIGSFQLDTSPLFVINGNAVNGGYSAVYNMVAANDIKSITVLKDAASASIYGSRGANGVVVITLQTKN